MLGAYVVAWLDRTFALSALRVSALLGQPLHWALCIVIALVGIACGALAVWSFRRKRTTLDPLQPSAATVLVTSGAVSLQ